MVENDKPQKAMQVCTLRIGFPVESDEQAIEYKKKISDILLPIPKARIDFNLVSVPIPAPNGS